MRPGWQADSPNSGVTLITFPGDSAARRLDGGAAQACVIPGDSMTSPSSVRAAEEEPSLPGTRPSSVEESGRPYPGVAEDSRSR